MVNNFTNINKNEQSLLTLKILTQKTPLHMAFEIQIWLVTGTKLWQD